MNPIRLGDLLDSTTKKLGVAVRLRQGLAVKCWAKVVGSEIARQTEPGPVRNKVMFVKTPNPVLAHQLRLLEKDILQRYRRILGGQCLRGLRVQIGQIVENIGDKAAEARRTGELPAERERELAALAAAIPHPDLAASFLRAVKAWAIRAKEPGRPESFMELMTGDTWPTAAEVRTALSRIEPARRLDIRDQVVTALRRKIMERVNEGVGDPQHVLSIRGDLRRLALAMDYPVSGLPREILRELFGTEARLYCPEQDW